MVTRRLTKMGSICGYASFNRPSVRLALDCLKSMTHRGSDSFGLFADDDVAESSRLKDLGWAKKANICLAYSRLNLPGETREQHLECVHQRPYLVLDGSLDNAPELSNLLQKHPATDQDSEILRCLINELYDGQLVKSVRSALKMVAGAYALAATDGNRVVLARDPVGIKPLYYTEKERTTYFASEKKAIWGFNRNVKTVAPGRIVEIAGGRTVTHLGVRLESPPIDIVDLDEAVELYRDSLVDSVKRSLRGLEGRNVGIIFSGGVDSTLIAKILKDLHGKLKCYCVGMEGSEDPKFAQHAAKSLNVELETITIDRPIIEEILQEVICSIETNGPVQVEAAIPIYLAAKKASEDGIGVMFNGQGPDELFAGYPWYPAVVRKDGYARLHVKLWEDVALSYADTFEREDKATMAHGVELKVPYANVNVVRTAMRISPHLKVREAMDQEQLGKWIHRQTALALGVPAAICYRKKSGAQHGSGVHAELESIARERFCAARVAQRRVKDSGSNYRYLSAHYGSPEELAYLHELGKILPWLQD